MMKQKKPKSDSDRLKSIGHSIKAARRSLGMTQSEFAEKLSISRKTCSNYEGGKRDPRTVFWIKLSELTGDDYLHLPGTTALRNKRIAASRRKQEQAKLSSLVAQKRRELIQLREEFDAQELTLNRRKLFATGLAIRDGAILAIILRFFATHYNFPFGEPIGGVDWMLPTALVLIGLLLPQQMFHSWKFFKWAKIQ